MRITRTMKRSDIEHRALDAIGRLTEAERKRFANVLRLLGLANGDRGLARLAKTVMEG